MERGCDPCQEYILDAMRQYACMQFASGHMYMGSTIFPEHGLECLQVVGGTSGENGDLWIPIQILLDYNLLLICVEAI